MSIRSLQLLFTLLLVAAASDAQYKNYSLRCLAPILENIDPEAPNSLQEAFLASPKYLAEPLEGVGAGAIEFPISTESAEAQRFFEQGVALLHVLWYEEAARAFRTVVELDPDCPMGYWGLAQANERTPQRARIFAQAARDRCDRNRPEFEQRWTRILANFYSNPDEDLSLRSSLRIRALEELALDFPDNLEVRAFLVRRLTLDPFVAGLPVISAMGVEALAEEIAEKSPKHPTRHYRVFLWMDRRPERVLSEAEKMTANSPRAAEIWRYSAEAHIAAAHSAEAAVLAEAALRVDHGNLAEKKQMPWQSQNLENNYEALVNLLIAAGRIEEAISWTRQALTLPRQLENSGIGAESLWMHARLSAGQWETFLKELETDLALGASDATTDEAMRLSWKGIVQLALGQREEASAVRDQLAEHQRNAIIEGISTFEEASISESQRRLETVYRLFAEGPQIPLQSSFADLDLPPLVKARLLELSGRNGDAYAHLKRVIDSHPYRWLPTAVFCRLAASSGNEREALFPIDRRFRSDASLADPDLPEFETLDALAEKLHLAEDWSIRAERKNLEIHLETLGPESWRAPAAPGFDQIDRLGNHWNLAQFSGRPVLLHFFLGIQCAFCLEQFDVFRPHLQDFSEAGIDLLAISIDNRDTLAKFLGTETNVSDPFRDRLPFPVLADPDLSVFREYGVFDDFENGPMHAIVLIAPDGTILWRNIAHTPFDDPEALLNEAVRLLRIRRFLPPDADSNESENKSITAP